jgi:L-threonylcarbamoyladenylate synthase
MYAALRDADTRKVAKVVVIEPLGEGIAIAIRDRLERASKGR